MQPCRGPLRPSSPHSVGALARDGIRRVRSLASVPEVAGPSSTEEATPCLPTRPSFNSTATVLKRRF